MKTRLLALILALVMLAPTAVFAEDGDQSTAFVPLTIEEVLEDIKSDRVKKVIFDADAGNEIDDQYALAYALACERFEVISVNASQFLNTALVPDRHAGMMEGYNEIKRVLKLLGREDIPVYKGVGQSMTKPDDGGIKYPQVLPVNAEAVKNIIDTAKASDEIIYIMVTGCATNISCAIARDPSIKDKICVVWMGSNHIDWGGAGEFNLGQDDTSGRYLMNSGVNFVWLPASSTDETKGTQVLKTGRAFLESAFPGEDAVSTFFRKDLPVEHDFGYVTNPVGWWHIFWDVAAPALFETPELMELEIIDIPRIRGDGVFSIEEGRPRGIILNRITEPQTVLDNMAKGIVETFSSVVQTPDEPVIPDEPVEPDDPTEPDDPKDPVEIVDSSEVFTDVKSKGWYKNAVDFVYSYGIMAGDGAEDTFRPNKTMNRAMVVTVLWRIEGEAAPSDSYVNAFTDLKQDWYKTAVHWAAENGIVKGKSETRFDPNASVTREELCAMIQRYLAFKGIATEDSADIDSFPDSAKVSKWAKENVKWAVGAGVIGGKAENGETILAPRGNATRAECATILMRICEKYELLK